MNRYKVYCGPTLVQSLSALLADEVYEVTQGTENVYVQTYLTEGELVSLLNTVMSGFTYRDVQQLY